MPLCRGSPPPTPEDILAAQLEQLGEIGSLASGTDGNGKGKASKKKGSGGGGGGAVGATAGTGNDGKLSGASGSEGVMYCSACGRQYSSAGVVEETLARAKSSWWETDLVSCLVPDSQ